MAAALAGAAYLLQILAGYQDWPKWLLVVIALLGALAAGLAVYIPLREQRYQERENGRLRDTMEERVREGVHQSLGDVVLPMARYVHLLSGYSPAVRTAREEVLKVKAVNAAKEGAYEIRDVRASFYDFKALLLTCEDNHSAGSTPPEDLTSRTDHGKHIIQAAKQGREVLEQDVSKSTVSWPQVRSFETIAVHPVHVGSELFGVLALDAPSPGALNERHMRLLSLLGKMLSAGIALCRDGSAASSSTP
ncbi:GAF domain-containing protein [Streptomyces sp. NPDC059567]|uniref:GAF domain-containing protein n=1 Tax=Streptomyces sp. NPDC059567 TaxID=3346867 RepID=UPI003675C11E